MKSILLVVCLSGIGCWGMGCAAYPATVHPEYDALQPEVVRVTPVENRTLHTNLRSYPTAGILQSALVDDGAIDVLRFFHDGAVVTLTKRGYTTDTPPPTRPNTPTPASATVAPTADLHLRLFGWVRSSGFAGRGVDTEFEVELVRRDSGVTLYKRRYRYRITDREYAGRSVSASVIGRGVKRCVNAALYYLPAAKKRG